MKMKDIIIAGLLMILFPLCLLGQTKNPEDINNWRGKTIMYFSPHPDDETSSIGTLAILASNGNKVYVVLYTTGNKGSRDLNMTSERLAQIRKIEDEEYRLALMLYYFDGKSAGSVAEVLGTSEQAIHTRLSRARKMLRKMLE